MEDLINELFGIIADHREEEGFMTTERIRNWAMQFDDADREFVLAETIHIFRQRYISKAAGRQHVKGIIDFIRNSTGFETVKELISNSVFVNNQTEGKSQRVLLAFLEEILTEDYNTSLTECNKDSPKYVIYLDDILCTGETIIDKLTDNDIGWFNLANPNGGTNYDQFTKNKSILILAYLAVHKRASDKIRGRLYYKLGEKELGTIKTIWDANFIIDNKLDNPNSKLNFMYPSEDDSPEIAACKEQIEEKVHAHGHNTEPITYRVVGAPAEEVLFSSHENRNRYERIILLKSIEYYQHVSASLRARPLGYGNYHDMNFGFGTLIFTWRNVPFNSPLVFWYPYHGCQPLFERVFT